MVVSLNLQKELHKGDPLAMSMYAISLQPLISLLHNRSTTKQCWFADDATGAGPLEEVKQWWDELREAGPPLGYYPNSKKCWLVVKPEKEGRAKEMFAGTGINITTEGRKHLGAALGSRSYLEQYLGGKVEDLVGEVTRFLIGHKKCFVLLCPIGEQFLLSSLSALVRAIKRALKWLIFSLLYTGENSNKISLRSA